MNRNYNNPLTKFSFLLFFLIITYSCNKKEGLEIKLYQVYYDDLPKYGFDNYNYVEFYFIFINHTEDSINIRNTSNEISLLPDTFKLFKNTNEFTFKNNVFDISYLKSQDTAFLIKRITFIGGRNEGIENINKLKNYLEQKNLNFTNEKINFRVHREIGYFGGGRMPYSINKLYENFNVEFNAYSVFTYEYINFY